MRLVSRAQEIHSGEMQRLTLKVDKIEQALNLMLRQQGRMYGLLNYLKQEVSPQEEGKTEVEDDGEAEDIDVEMDQPKDDKQSELKSLNEWIETATKRLMQEYSNVMQDWRRVTVQHCEEATQRDLNIVQHPPEDLSANEIQYAKCQTEIKEWVRNRILTAFEEQAAANVDPQASHVSITPKLVYKKKRRCSLSRNCDILAFLIAGFAFCGATSKKQVETAVMCGIGLTNRNLLILKQIQELGRDLSPKGHNSIVEPINDVHKEIKVKWTAAQAKEAYGKALIQVCM